MNTSNLILIDSIVIIALCLFGVLLPKLFKDEEVRYGMNAINVAFAIGFLFNLVIFLLAELLKQYNMEYVAGIIIVFLFGVCIWGIIDVIRQLNKQRYAFFCADTQQITRFFMRGIYNVLQCKGGKQGFVCNMVWFIIQTIYTINYVCGISGEYVVCDVVKRFFASPHPVPFFCFEKYILFFGKVFLLHLRQPKIISYVKLHINKQYFIMGVCNFCLHYTKHFFRIFMERNEIIFCCFIFNIRY